MAARSNHFADHSLSLGSHHPTWCDFLPARIMPIRLRKLPTAFHLAISLLSSAVVFLTGCASPPFRPATVSDSQIANPTIGFKGYTLSIPQGFVVYDPHRPLAARSGLISNLARDHNAFVVRLIARDQKKSFVRVEESFLLHNGTLAAIFQVATMDIRGSLSQLDDRQQEALLNNAVAMVAPKRDSSIETTMHAPRKIAGHWVASVTVMERIKHSDGRDALLQAEVALMPGDMNELFIVQAIGTPAHGPELQSMMEQLLQNIGF
jgi:hypothetical protein